tara:strand:+ start:516 stop:1061 length:546 start_codon:yes stop_codon:yes gene_type:complete
MTITLSGTSGINTPGVVNTAAQTVATTLAVTGVSTLTGGFTVGATAAPAFSATSSAGTTLANVTYVKVTFDTESFDTNSNFASSRFTPTVAGYYQINSNIVYLATVTVTQVVLAIYKNGTVINYINTNNPTNTNSIAISSIISMNGSTDYIEIFCYMAGTGTLSSQGGSQTTFNGAMIRSA